MNETEKEIWDTLNRHLTSVFSRDVETYVATTAEDLSLYEWFILPHRQDGLPFHLFMIENSWADSGNKYRYDLWEPRLQLYGDTAIVSYTFSLTTVRDDSVENSTLSAEKSVSHRTHNESRVLIRQDDVWKIVHVHKSPSWQAPQEPG